MWLWPTTKNVHRRFESIDNDTVKSSMQNFTHFILKIQTCHCRLPLYSFVEVKKKMLHTKWFSTVFLYAIFVPCHHIACIKFEKAANWSNMEIFSYLGEKWWKNKMVGNSARNLLYILLLWTQLQLLTLNTTLMCSEIVYVFFYCNETATLRRLEVELY